MSETFLLTRPAVVNATPLRQGFLSSTTAGTQSAQSYHKSTAYADACKDVARIACNFDR